MLFLLIFPRFKKIRMIRMSNTKYSIQFIYMLIFLHHKVQNLVMYDCNYKIIQLVNSTTWFLRDSAASDTEAQPFKFWHLSQLHVYLDCIYVWELRAHFNIKNCCAFVCIFLNYYTSIKDIHVNIFETFEFTCFITNV